MNLHNDRKSLINADFHVIRDHQNYMFPHAVPANQHRKDIPGDVFDSCNYPTIPMPHQL